MAGAVGPRPAAVMVGQSYGIDECNPRCNRQHGSSLLGILWFKDMPRRVGQMPQIEYHEEQKKSPEIACRLLCVSLTSNRMSKCLLDDSLSTNRMQIKSDENVIDTLS